MGRKFGAALNGVAEPHRRESHVGRVATVGDGGKSISVTNMNNSQLRNLVSVAPYGISSSPTSGLMSFVLVIGTGSKDGMIGVYDKDKPSCKPGECIVYSSGGATVKCTSKGKVMINDRDILDEIDKIQKRLDQIN